VLIPFILTAFLHNPINAKESGNLRFEHFMIDEGLSQNTVNCIYQDRKGFIWIGTNEGLNKYDGYEFKVFDKYKGSDNNLSDDWIKCLTEDREGNIWIGTGSDGINIYNSREDTFSRLNLENLPVREQDKNDIFHLLEGNDGSIWFAIRNSINNIIPGSGKIKSYTPSHFSDEDKFKSNIAVTFEDSRNNLWFGTEADGLGLFNRKDSTYRYFTYDQYDNQSISGNNIRSIYESSEGKLWVGTYNGGFNLFDYETKQFKRFYPNTLVRESLTIKTIIEDDNGNLWLGTRNGLYLFNIAREFSALP